MLATQLNIRDNNSKKCTKIHCERSISTINSEIDGFNKLINRGIIILNVLREFFCNDISCLIVDYTQYMDMHSYCHNEFTYIHNYTDLFYERYLKNIETMLDHKKNYLMNRILRKYIKNLL